MQFDNLPDSAVGFSNLLLAIGGVRNMRKILTLVELHERLSIEDKEILVKVWNWDRPENKITIGTLPFVGATAMFNSLDSFFDMDFPPDEKIETRLIKLDLITTIREFVRESNDQPS